MPTRRLGTIAVAALALLPALAALHSRSFFSPDETNYTQVAREMLETADFVVPHLDGHVWFNKPPLAYWLLAGSFAALGWGLAAAVLLNTLLTAGTALLVRWHVARTGTERAGLLAAAAYLTMALPIAVARTALTDATLVLCTTAAVVAFLARGRATAALAGVMLGLGVLAKGPVAPLVVLPALAVAAWPDRRAGGIRRLVFTLAAAVAVVAPWQLALAARGEWLAWAREFLGYEVLSRATESWRIAAPWWYYVPVLLAGVFPWATHLALAAVAARSRPGALQDAIRRYQPEVAAVCVPVVVFSLATNKLPHYVLPVFPFIAAWLGRAADARWDLRERPPRRVAAVLALTGGGTLAALAWLAGHSRAARFLPPATAAVLAAAAVVLVALALLEGAGRRRAAWVGMAALALALRLGIDLGLAPFLDRQTPERPLADAVRTSLPAGGLPIAHRWWRTGFLAYGVRGWRQTESEEQLSRALHDAWGSSRPALIVVRSDSEGEARAAVWRAGGEAQERARIVGLGEIDGEVIEGIVFLAAPARTGERWFYDADEPTAGELGFSGFEGNPWVTSFRWSVSGEVRLDVRATPASAATLRLRAWALADAGVPQSARVSLNTSPLGTLTLGGFPSVHALAVPAACLQPGAQKLVVHTRHLVAPSLQSPTSHDDRTLGLALDWLSLDPASPTTSLVK